MEGDWSVVGILKEARGRRVRIGPASMHALGDRIHGMMARC